MRIDLSAITDRKFSSSIVIGGYDSSKISLDLKDNEKICVVNDQDKLFASSYLLGLLKPLMERFTDIDAFKAKLDLGGISYTNQMELLRAVNRYYYSERLKVGRKIQ